MSNPEHIRILREGIVAWNRWRLHNKAIKPDLCGEILSGLDLHKWDLRDADLSEADLANSNLTDIDLMGANLRSANLVGADLTDAYIYNANLMGADLSLAKLVRTDLGRANLTNAKLDDACLINCFVYGVSAWDVKLKNTVQSNLIITRPWQPRVTVDNLEMAQFIYLLLNNQKIRHVIDTITSKVVLILGRFTEERKSVLDGLREELRTYDYLPVIFDFEKPGNRDFTETIRTLAHLARFIIADLTDPSSIAQELQAIVPDLAVPVQPILEEHKREYAMFIDFSKYYWVLPIYTYSDGNALIKTIKETIIFPVEKKVNEIEINKYRNIVGD
ncbi:hypothetical protein KDW_39000 [Dictyobacter vulcani]|uniref:Pentapeptide repeat-containing protein n=1 Tax=Dictyobacter vulcani TaxID=2607529 RepID=A0A5J4KJ48_9CHLR|nr:pentapeptide repeat-containing protein [Dictyobacter vulcani]GER89738.1 hypothetical protein KDW_39000 [Dictyobacter vulcani]